MKKNICIVILLVAVAALATLAVKQRQQIAQLKEQAPIAVAATERLQVPEAPAPVTETRESRPETKVAGPTASPSPSAQTGASGGVASNYFGGLANMMKNPQMKEMIRSQQKVMLNRQYGSLSKYLNIPADQLDALKELLADRQMAMVDAGMAMMSGSELERKQAVEETKAIQADYDKKIQELLGSQDYPVFQDYEKTLNERMSVQMFKDALPATDALSDQQEDNLIAAMYQETKDMPASSLMNNQNQDPSQFTEERIAEQFTEERIADLEKRMEQLQQKYTARAAGILTPAQLEQFTKWQQQWNAMQVASRKMAAQMFGNKNSTPRQLKVRRRDEDTGWSPRQAKDNPVTKW